MMYDIYVLSYTCLYLQDTVLIELHGFETTKSLQRITKKGSKYDNSFLN